MSQPPDKTSSDRKMKSFYLIAGEHSGDALGSKLMEALKAEHPGQTIEFKGLGGEGMEAEGLKSIFPMEEVAVMGPTAILARLPFLVRRVYQCVDAVIKAKPDALIIIDSPELTHPIAKRVRKRAPDIPVINYVSPTIWAWRPGRARKMKPYVDEVLALLPFEPDYHRKLGGPSCHYVGHPLIEKKPWIDKLDSEQFRSQHNLKPGQKTLVILPGSRPNEIRHLTKPFGEAIALLIKKVGPLNLLLPTVKSQKQAIAKATESWQHKPLILLGEENKFKSFKLADAALAASGTVTLELALAQTPMVVAYKVDRYLKILKPLMKVDMYALANHVRGQKAFPELIQENCRSDLMAEELALLLDENSSAYKQQKQHLAVILEKLELSGQTPSQRAAELCLETIAFKKN